MIRARDRQRFRRAPRLLLVWVVALGWPGSARADSNDPWWGRDKALHLTVSAGLASGGYALSSLVLDRPWQRATAGAAFSLTLGIAKEIRDSMGYGQASYKDFAFDVAGTALGITLAYLVDWATSASEPPAPASQEAALSRSPLSLTF